MPATQGDAAMTPGTGEMPDIDDDRPDDPPLYVEITQDLIARIFDGRIRHASLLPPARRLAAHHGVSVSTARRGLRLLATLGWARYVPGHPYQAIRPRHPGTVPPRSYDYVPQ
jgi:DNA-binding FadR family transcriptional regulator